MKYLFTLILLITSLITFSQTTIKQDVNGNYIQTKLVDTSTKANKQTGKTFTDTKGNIYPVYISPNNKFYVIRTSKNGNQYKQYLKL